MSRTNLDLRCEFERVIRKKYQSGKPSLEERLAVDAEGRYTNMVTAAMWVGFLTYARTIDFEQIDRGKGTYVIARNRLNGGFAFAEKPYIHNGLGLARTELFRLRDLHNADFSLFRCMEVARSAVAPEDQLVSLSKVADVMAGKEISTGFPDLDKVLKGGIPANHIACFSAKTPMARSILAPKQEAPCKAEQDAPYPLSDYALDQWWVKEMEYIFNAPVKPALTDNLKRAIHVALNLARLVLPPTCPCENVSIENHKDGSASCVGQCPSEGEKDVDSKS